MLVTIVTPCLNRIDTIQECLASVSRQTHVDIEHIVVDGGSRDGTLEAVLRYPHVAQLVSEPDEGLYDAINKGLALASGDVIGILNSDDYLADATVIERVVAKIEQGDLDAVYSDVAFFRSTPKKRVTRRYSSAGFRKESLTQGFMPAHPTLYLRSQLYRESGGYRTNYKIAADYEFMIRLFLQRETLAAYIPGVAVFMREGGVSNSGIRSRWILNEEILQAFRENDIRPSRIRILMRYWRKSFEFLRPAQERRKASPQSILDLDWIKNGSGS